MTAYFLYGTLVPGSRHAGMLATAGAKCLGDASLNGGYRMSVRYRGHGDDIFDRTRSSHYVEPILVLDPKSKDRICGTLIEAGQEFVDYLGKVIGRSRAYPLTPVRLEQGEMVMTTIRVPGQSSDIIYRTDPCLHRYEDGRVRFYDAATYLITTNEDNFPADISKTKIKGPAVIKYTDVDANPGLALESSIYQIAASDLYHFDIAADTGRRRISVDLILSDGQIVPAFQYVPR